MMTAAQLCEYTEGGWVIVQFEWLNYTVCELHLNKAIKKKR